MVMKSVYLSTPKDISIKEIPVPVCSEGYAKIKVKSVGICGSDVAAYAGKSLLCTYPRIIGHEISGEIVEIGPNTINDKELRVGDRVVIEPYIYCGKCYPCSIGRTNCCENLNVLGVHVDGGMSEYFSHPVKLIHKVPDSVPYEDLAIVEPLTIALHALHRLELKGGEHVVIFGAGPIGNLAAQAALYMKDFPIVVDILDSRLDIVKSVGVVHTINSSSENLIERIKEITSGRMAECVVEATGAPAVIRSTIDAVSFAGRIAFVGWPKQEISMPTSLFTKKELDVRGSRSSVKDFPLAIDMVAGKKVNVKSIISKVVGIDELPESVKLLADKPADYLKIVGVL